MQMDQKLVSVNITTYNRALLLRRCLDSVLEQRYGLMEVVVVDDCSQDETSVVMEEYLKRDTRIKYIRHKTNKGNAQARNTALQQCNGYYVAFMDDDDEWIDPDKLVKQVQIFEESTDPRLGIICSSVKRIDKQGREKVKIEHRPLHLTSHILVRNGIIHNSTVMTKRHIMLEIGGFDIDLPYGIDAEFFRTMIVEYKYDIHFMPDVTTAYHEHDGMRMTTNSNADIKKTLKANIFIIRKHLKVFLIHPWALIYRIYLGIKKILMIKISNAHLREKIAAKS